MSLLQRWTWGGYCGRYEAGRDRPAPPISSRGILRLGRDPGCSVSTVKRIDLLDLSDTERELIRECEVQGTRTLFERNGRPVAVLISHDEYLALRETVELSSDALLFARLEMAEEETRTGRMLLIEDLLQLPDHEGRAVWNDRLRLAESIEEDWKALQPAEREAALPALQAIDDDPIIGAPLFEPLKGLWSHRAGRVRILYRIVAEGRFIAILSITRAAAG